MQGKIHLGNKKCSPCLQSLVKNEANVWENSRRSRGFPPAREFSQTLPRFSPGYEGTENMFYFVNKMNIFRRNKGKDDIGSAFLSRNCKFSQLGDSQSYCSSHFRTS